MFPLIGHDDRVNMTRSWQMGMPPEGFAMADHTHRAGRRRRLARGRTAPDLRADEDGDPNEHPQELIADPSNAGQVGAWDGNEGAFWAAQARRFDETLASCHGPFLAAAAIRDDDRVLDVGCGNGQTTRDVARIAANGSALGVDLSSQMLALARDGRGRRRSRQRRVPTRRRADLPVRDRRVRRRDLAHGFDVLRRSDRGVRQPPSCVAPRRSTHTPHLARRHRQRVAHRVPFGLGRRPRPPDATPRRAQPVRTRDPDRVRAILDAAGFVDISFESLHGPMSFGPDSDDAFDFVSGLTGWMRDGLDEAGRDAALAALRTTIAAHTGDRGVTYQSATWIIHAHKP